MVWSPIESGLLELELLPTILRKVEDDKVLATSVANLCICAFCAMIADHCFG